MVLVDLEEAVLVVAVLAEVGSLVSFICHGTFLPKKGFKES